MNRAMMRATTFRKIPARSAARIERAHLAAEVAQLEEYGEPKRPLYTAAYWTLGILVPLFIVMAVFA